ncbi:MAG: hydratase [Alphaproteobacteria bacterium]|nr:hydratase [Alphaproteobacteria bacterium]
MVDVDVIAAEMVGLLGTGGSTRPLTSCVPAFGLAEAYRVTARVRARREAKRERVVGRKIGFSNRTIWPEYQVDAPIWGYMYDRTVRDGAAARDGVGLAELSEPLIEPEIVFGLRAAPRPDMDEKALLGCIDSVGHGFEIVQSVFPGGKFAAPDAVAGYGLHGAYFIGPRLSAHEGRTDWIAALGDFEIELVRGAERMDRGHARNVLDGPLRALGHLVALLDRDPDNPPLAAGEIVTTGTVTRAFPVRSVESWSTRLHGLPLEGIAIRFA